MDFVAMDVETANADMASLCSVGAARFSDGRVVEEFYTLLDPRDYFDSVNVSIHGITEAADLAASIGYEVAAGVTKKTTLLVFGDVDVSRLNGHEKSGKHRKAEELGVRIIRETDFLQMVQLA